jgi:hypothetical protein
MMRKCPECHVSVKGDWDKCPLCEAPLDSNIPVTSSSMPDVPLQFNRRFITQFLMAFSLIVVAVILGIGLLYYGRIQLFQGAAFGIITMWLAVLTLIRKRRNIAKSLLYLLIILSLMCIYLDYTIGWSAWSLTYAVPIICSSTLISMIITARMTRMKPGDYVLYWAAVAILSLVPIIFLLIGWIQFKTPSLISFGFGLIVLIYMLVTKGQVIWGEIKKRTFI